MNNHREVFSPSPVDSMFAMVLKGGFVVGSFVALAYVLVVNLSI